MKHKLLSFILLLSALIAGTGSVWAEDEVYKTALFGASYNASNSSYTSSFDATNSGFVVTATNFNNNNNGWTSGGLGQIKCGRDGKASVATIITKSAIDRAITKVLVKIDAITTAKVNSIKLYTSSNGKTWTEAGTFKKATGNQSVALTSPAANLYYKVEFNCASGSSNGLVTISKVEYYKEKATGHVAVTSVTLDEKSLDLEIGDNATLTATVLPSTATDMAVTWSSSNEGVATVENGVVTAVSAGSTTITVTTEDGGKTATCDVTVSVPVQATSVNITFNNALYGTSYTGTNAADKGPFVGTTDKIIVTVKQGSGSNMYINDTETRIYGGTTKGTVKLNAPSGYVMTKIVFNGGTEPGKWDITASTGTLDKATWTGSASEVTFSASSRSDFTRAVVTLAPTVTITTASYATYVSVHALDFTGKNIEAYIAQADGTTGVTFTRVNKVPANTGVLLYKDGGTTEAIPVLSGDAEDVTGNVFKQGTGAAVASEDGNLHNYILNNVGGVVGFYKAAGKTVATNRAYIQIDEKRTPVKGFIALPGSDEETGIETMRDGENEKMSAIFDLSGRRVAKPTRGLYIVNGKKVLVK